MSERLLITHCAPTLAGLKTANLYACPVSDPKAHRKELSEPFAPIKHGSCRSKYQEDNEEYVIGINISLQCCPLCDQHSEGSKEHTADTYRHDKCHLRHLYDKSVHILYIPAAGGILNRTYTEEHK